MMKDKRFRADALIRRDHHSWWGLNIIKGGVPTVQPGTVIGHEATGVVTEVGNSVQNVFSPPSGRG